MQSKRKVILFGGSFDPIHTGHLRVAQYALEELDAGKLIFIPARRSPHKTESPVAGHHRLSMIRIAIEGMENVSVSDCELNRSEPSYTLDTVYFFREQFGSGVVLHWLIGADQLADLDKWYRVQELLNVCRISVMVRAGYPLPDFGRFEEVLTISQINQLKNDFLLTPRIDLSSTDIRCQLAQGTINPGILPPNVLPYIVANRLYGFQNS
jgi:nicotinate-nucleotide adenylyltransferase